MYHEEREEIRKNHRKLDLEKSLKILDYWETAPFMGYRKIAYLLRKDGFKWASERLVRRLMSELGISSLAVKNTSKPGKGKNHEKYPYLLRHKVITHVNLVWSTDITYIQLPHGFVYLCAVIDWYSRKILSWRLSNTMDVQFCIDTLEDAIQRFGTPAIFNSDQGSQFTSNRFLEVLKREHIQISMDGRGQALDNIYCERTWKTLKYEHIFLHDYSTMTELRDGLAWFIGFFNTRRPHESLGYDTPDEVYYNTFTGVFNYREKIN